MIKAIIFDFDGVIVDTEIEKFNQLQKILNSAPFILKKEDFKKMIGKKTDAFLSEKFPKMKQSKIEEILKLRRKFELSEDNKKLIPGIKELLEFIKSKKIKIAITTGSNKKIVEKINKTNKINKFFDLLITGEEFIQSKPSPECYELTLKKLNLSSNEVIIIEDSVAGIKSAKSTKCKVFGIMTYLDKKELHEADDIFKNHFETLEYFKKNIII